LAAQGAQSFSGSASQAGFGKLPVMVVFSMAGSLSLGLLLLVSYCRHRT
jgi:hypothetical protein